MDKKQSLPLHIVILAAGKSTRMRSMLPKVLHPLAHKPALAWVIDTATTLEPASITLVLGADHAPFAEIVARYPDLQIATQAKADGTGGALKAAPLPQEGIVVVLYGDTPFIQPETIRHLCRFLQEDRACGAAVLGFKYASPHHAYGRFILDAKQRLTNIIEDTEADAATKSITLCNAGFMAIRASLLQEGLKHLPLHPGKQEYYLTDLVAWLHQQGHTVHPYYCDPTEVIGINTREELAMAEGFAQLSLRRSLLASGVSMPAPETVMLSADTCIGEESVVEPYVVFGPGVTIGKHCHIRSFSYLEGCTAADSVVIGPYARLRPGTVIEEEARVGNFVEIKKSHIGRGSKIPHLSYIGDTTMGAGCNIGAGTVTCNYDGKQKHQTLLGDNVFVGSNSALIAPITLGNNAMVGAGTTVTKPVGAGELALNNAEQKRLRKKL